MYKGLRRPTLKEKSGSQFASVMLQLLRDQGTHSLNIDYTYLSEKKVVYTKVELKDQKIRKSKSTTPQERASGNLKIK